MKIDLIKLKIRSICKFITYKENKELIKIYSADWRKRFSNICLGDGTNRWQEIDVIVFGDICHFSRVGQVMNFAK